MKEKVNIEGMLSDLHRALLIRDDNHNALILSLKREKKDMLERFKELEWRIRSVEERTKPCPCPICTPKLPYKKCQCSTCKKNEVK